MPDNTFWSSVPPPRLEIMVRPSSNTTRKRCAHFYFCPERCSLSEPPPQPQLNSRSLQLSAPRSSQPWPITIACATTRGGTIWTAKIATIASRRARLAVIGAGVATVRAAAGGTRRKSAGTTDEKGLVASAKTGVQDARVLFVAPRLPLRPFASSALAIARFPMAGLLECVRSSGSTTSGRRRDFDNRASGPV